MRFEKCHGWRVSFLDRENQGVRFRDLTFADRSKLEDLVARTPTKMVLADKQAFELALNTGRGAVDLVLTEDQYRKLRR
jgi:hypothetical protein